MKQLSGKVAVVTGAASGIGLAMCETFCAEGMRVVMADVEPQALNDAAERLRGSGGRVLAVVTDVSSADAVDTLAHATVEAFGTAHLLCNNAGVGDIGDPWEGPLSSWEWTLGVNLMGVVHGVRSFLPMLRAHDESHIVNTASIAGITPMPGGPYAASKYAVVGLSQSLFLGEQLLATGVGVSVLCPGFVRTRVGSCERNWPSRLGPLPQTPPEFEFLRQTVLQAIDSGMEPSVVAAEVVTAITDRRFWIMTDDDWMPAVVQHCHAVAEQRNPTLPPVTPR